MRRLLTFIMILSLLSVTSMPVQAEEPVCQSAMRAASECGSCNPLAEPQAAHASAAKLHGHDRIECGCGCHRDIDGLPHVLEPCSLIRAGLDVAILSLHVTWPVVRPLSLQVYLLQRPPPRILS